ncbi:MAG: sensor histidine kinase [Vallitaleaceae bacterium]|jgi:two-component system sensor histidine kinase YesM|nr:sensor histidine kinase [Vallitaleaceae bacterium]
MNYWSKLYRNRKVSHKIFIVYIILIAVTIVLLSTIVISVSSNAIEELADSNTLQMIKQVNASIELYIEEYENIIYYISENDEVHRFLNDEENHKGIEALSIYESRNKGIVGLVVVSNDDRILSDSMERISRDPLMEEDWYIRALNNPTAFQVISNPVGRNVRILDTNTSADDVVSLSKAIINENGAFIGVILMDVHVSIFEAVIEDTVIGKSGFVFMMDSDNKIVYTKVNDIVYRIKPEIFEYNKNGTTVQIYDSRYKVISEDSDYLGWKFIGVFSLEEELASVNYIRIFILIATGILIVLSFFISYILSNTITKPIAKLKELMYRAEKGELDVYFESDYDDEIGELGHRFNAMINSMNELIEMVYSEQKQKREAELEIFRAQIKPHFLYNTLDTIHWLIKEEKNDEAVKVVIALTRLFRISLSKGKEHILLNDELKHVESYLTVQSVRYEDQFDYTIVCDAHIRQLTITKLILQPIVENSLYHGIKEKRGKGHIGINISIDEHVICIEVTDDGVGMSEEQVIHINDVLDNKKMKINEYGLINVNEKIKLSFGSAYGVQVASKLGYGTTVIIRHPII